MMQAPAPIPLWLELLKLVLGPMIAASVVIIGLIWRDRIERRNAAQAWYEQTYITEGLDVIIAHLAVLCHSISEGRRVMTDVRLAPLPSAVSRRLFSLLLFDFISGVETAEAVLLASGRNDHPLKLSKDESKELLAFCIGLGMYADELRMFLLDKRIKVKSDVYKIAKDPKFIARIKYLQDNFLENLQDNFPEKIDLRTMNEGLKMKYRPRITEAARALKGTKSPPTS